MLSSCSAVSVGASKVGTAPCDTSVADNKRVRRRRQCRGAQVESLSSSCSSSCSSSQRRLRGAALYLRGLLRLLVGLFLQHTCVAPPLSHESAYLLCARLLVGPELLLDIPAGPRPVQKEMGPAGVMLNPRGPRPRLHIGRSIKRSRYVSPSGRWLGGSTRRCRFRICLYSLSGDTPFTAAIFLSRFCGRG